MCDAGGHREVRGCAVMARGCRAALCGYVFLVYARRVPAMCSVATVPWATCATAATAIVRAPALRAGAASGSSRGGGSAARLAVFA